MMNHGAHTPDTELLDDALICGECDGSGIDNAPRFPWQATTCPHCKGSGEEPVQSPEAYTAMVADEQNDTEWLENRHG